MAWMARILRSRGAASGVLLMLLGAWGALVPFIGPYFGYAYTPAMPTRRLRPPSRGPGGARVARSSMTTCRPRKPRTRLPRAARCLYHGGLARPLRQLPGPHGRRGQAVELLSVTAGRRRRVTAPRRAGRSSPARRPAYRADVTGCAGRALRRVRCLGPFPRPA